MGKFDSFELEGSGRYLYFQRSGRRLNGKERIQITDHGIIDNIKKTVLLNINNMPFDLICPDC